MLDRRDFLMTTLVASMTAADAQVNAQSPQLFPGFTARRIQTSGAVIHTLVGGSGPPLLLIHGYPQTHVEWHKLVPTLAQRFTVVYDRSCAATATAASRPTATTTPPTRSAPWHSIKSR